MIFRAGAHIPHDVQVRLNRARQAAEKLGNHVYNTPTALQRTGMGRATNVPGGATNLTLKLATTNEVVAGVRSYGDGVHNFVDVTEWQGPTPNETRSLTKLLIERDGQGGTRVTPLSIDAFGNTYELK